MLDHSFVISSFQAVKVDPGTGQQTPYTADESGFIAAQAGDILRFPNPQAEGYVALNAITLHAGANDIKLAINDNEQHALFVPAGASMGISSLAVYSLTVLEACVFRYEGLAM